MNTDTRTTRWLGAAFVAQFVTSMAFAVVSVKVLAGGAAGALAAACVGGTCGPTGLTAGDGGPGEGVFVSFGF